MALRSSGVSLAMFSCTAIMAPPKVSKSGNMPVSSALTISFLDQSPMPSSCGVMLGLKPSPAGSGPPEKAQSFWGAQQLLA